MVGFLTEPIETNRALDRQGTNAVPSSTGEVLNATLEDAFTRNPTPSLFREIRRTRQDVAGILGEMEEDEAAPRLMEPDEANERFGIEGKLTFDAATTEGVAEELNRLKREELQREDVFRRAQGGAGQWSARFGVGLAASALDPLNVASAFIPIVGPSRYALWLEGAGSALGRAGIRARVGAVEGLAGAALLEPIVYGVAKSEQADYTAADSMLNLAFGTVLGGGLHAGFGAVADSVRGPLARQIESMEPAEREASLRTAIAQVAEGRPVDVDAFFLRQELLSGTSLGRSAGLPPAMEATLRDVYGVTARDMPLIDMPALANLSEAESLRIRAAQLDEEIAGLRADDKAGAAAKETLARLEVVERELSRAGLTGPEIKALRARRDELLTDTTPEALRATVEPLERRRVLQAERSNIDSRLKEMADSAGNKAVSALLARSDIPLPQRQANLGQIQAAIDGMRAEQQAASKANLERAVSRVVRQDVAGFVDPTDIKTAQSIPPAPKGVTPEIARQESVKDVDNMLQTVTEAINEARTAGRLTEGDLKALGEADELVKRADVMGRAAKAGAACLAQ